MKPFIQIPSGAEYDDLPVQVVKTSAGQVQSKDLAILKGVGYRKQLPPQAVTPGYVVVDTKLVDVDGVCAQYQITQIPQAEYDQQQADAKAAADKAVADAQTAFDERDGDFTTWPKHERFFIAVLKTLGADDQKLKDLWGTIH